MEHRFDLAEAVLRSQELELLNDNGAAYIAVDTLALAHTMGVKSVNTPVCSQQSDGIAESFVSTFKHD